MSSSTVAFGLRYFLMATAVMIMTPMTPMVSATMPVSREESMTGRWSVAGVCGVG